MALPPSRQARDQNLDTLEQAANDWFDQEEQRLDLESKFLKSVLQARGANESAALNLAGASTVVQDEIAAFLFIGTVA